MNQRPPAIVFARVKRVIARAISAARLAMKADSQWKKLPGSIELEDTGYQIRFVQISSTPHGQPIQAFAAYDPEGNLIASTPGNLEGLMQFAEKQARQRQELDL